MSISKSATAVLLAAAGALAMSATAFAVNVTPAAAGPLTIVLVCDTGPNGSGTFTVTANGRSMSVTVACGRSATVTNVAWKAGSTAVIHQTVVPTGALRARDVSITLMAAAQMVVTGLTAPQQLAVDQPHNLAYVVEYASPGRLLRIDLTNNSVTTVVPKLDHPIGLAWPRTAVSPT